MLAAAAVVATAAASLVGFQTPTKHIACLYVSGKKPSLRCDVSGIPHRPKRPKSCLLDYGSAFGLDPSGKARRLCVGDTVMNPKNPVLAYGKTRTLGPFTCTSRESGLRCVTQHGKHGFELSLTRQRLF